MAALQMTQLMADVEAHAVRVGLHRVHHAGQQHDEAAPQELRGKGVQRAAALQHIGLGRAGHAQLLAAAGELPVQVRELLGAQLHAIAAHMGHQGRLREHVEHKAEQQHGQHDPEGADDQPQPDQRAQAQHHGAERALARVYPFLHLVSPCLL